MKRLGISIMLLGSGCGIQETEKIHRTEIHEEQAEPCNVIEFDDGVEISCPDGSTATVYHGKNGSAGVDGKDGKDGDDGINGQDGKNGIDGQDGQDGKDGQNGKDGLDGLDGQDGKDGKIKQGQPIYIGYYCNRVVLRINNKYYVVHGGLVLLDKGGKWVKISNSCKIKRKKNKIIQGS